MYSSVKHNKNWENLFQWTEKKTTDLWGVHSKASFVIIWLLMYESKASLFSRLLASVGLCFVSKSLAHFLCQQKIIWLLIVTQNILLLMSVQIWCIVWHSLAQPQPLRLVRQKTCKWVPIGLYSHRILAHINIVLVFWDHNNKTDY